MKISTRLFGVLALMLVQFSALAATITVEVGDNFYRPATVNIRPGDKIRWVNVGTGVHPTVSESTPAAWQTFVISPSNTTRSVTFNTLGTYDYYCSAHASVGGGVRVGMIGTITVTTTPLATLDSKAAAIGLDIYPNPSKGLVVLTVNKKAGADNGYKLRLSNIIGREVRTFTLRPEAATTGMPLNLSDLPAGMYVYSLMLNDKVVATRRLVLQN